MNLYFHSSSIKEFERGAAAALFESVSKATLTLSKPAPRLRRSKQWLPGGKGWTSGAALPPGISSSPQDSVAWGTQDPRGQTEWWALSTSCGTHKKKTMRFLTSCLFPSLCDCADLWPKSQAWESLSWCYLCLSPMSTLEFPGVMLLALPGWLRLFCYILRNPSHRQSQQTLKWPSSLGFPLAWTSCQC